MRRARSNGCAIDRSNVYATLYSSASEASVARPTNDDSVGKRTYPCGNPLGNMPARNILLLRLRAVTARCGKGLCRRVAWTERDASRPTKSACAEGVNGQDNIADHPRASDDF